MSKSRTINFLQNAGGSAIYQIVNSICGLITPRIILACYGSNLNGLVSSITQFLSCLAVVEAGLALASQQSLYKPLAEKNYDKISSIVSATRQAYNHIGMLFTALTALLAFLYPFFADVKGLKYAQVVLLVFILAMNYVLSFFVISKYQALFQADQKVYIISLSKTVARILNTLLIVLCAYSGTSILIMKAVCILSLVAQSLIIWIYAKKHYSSVNYYAAPDKTALGQRWDAMYLQVLSAVTVSFPAMLLTVFSDLEQVSVYTVYNMVFSALMGVLGIFISGINASFGDLIVSSDKKRINDVYSEFENAYYVLIFVIYFITAVMIEPFIGIYTQGITDTNYMLKGIGILFTLNALLYNIKTPQGMMVQAAGLFRATRLQNTIQALILFIGGLVLGAIWGIYGILLASILSNAYRCIDLMIFIPRHVTGGSVLHSFLRVGIMMIVCVPSYILMKTLLNIIIVDSWLKWIIVACVVSFGTVVIFGITTFVFERKYCISTVKRILNMLKRKRV